MIHHSLTEDGQTVSWGAIERYHVETNGWEDIGYHYGVELVQGNFYALLGRAEERRAAACPQQNMNSLALHICIVGNFDIIKPPREAMECAARRVIIPAMKRYLISYDNIVGHRDFNPAKSCPGRLFNMDELKNVIRGMI